MSTKADRAATSLLSLQKGCGWSPRSTEAAQNVAGLIDDLLEVARQFRGLQDADGMECTCTDGDKCPVCKTTDVLS